MPDNVTLAGDLFIPELANQYVQMEFYGSLGVMDNLVGMTPEKPIQLTNFGFLNGGQYAQRPKIQEVSGLVARRDATSFADVDLKKITSTNERAVLLNARVGPVAIAVEEALRMARQTPGMLEAYIAQQAAFQFRKYVQTALIYAIKAAVAGMTAAAHTYTVWNAAAKTNLSTPLLTMGLSKMGDTPDQINNWLFRSECFTDLNVFQQGQGNMVSDRAAQGIPSTLGRPWTLYDHAALLTADADFDKYYSIGLGPNAAQLEIVSPIRFLPAQQWNKGDTPYLIISALVDLAIGITGFQWDSANGGANPALATTLATSSNWDPVYDNAQQVKLILIEHNMSGGS